MNLRAKQLESTRELILDAAEKLFFSETDPAAITVQAIADLAGVSHRTMYRHFESRGDLVHALGQRMDASVDGGIVEPTTFDDWIAGSELLMNFAATHKDQLTRIIAVSMVNGDWRTDRNERYFGLFRERFANLDDATARQDFAALRHLLGAKSFVMMSSEFELPFPEVRAGAERAIRAFIADIDKRDKKASKAN